MTRRSSAVAVVLGLVLAALGVAGAPTAPEAQAAAVRHPCRMDVYGQTRDGKIKLRRLLDARVTVAKSSGRAVPWKPIAWGTVMANTWPGHEETHQIVASTDGRVRLVRTEWNGAGALQLRVLKVLGSGYPSRLVAFDDDSTLYWVAADGVLHRVSWNGRRLVRPAALPITIREATTLTAEVTERGSRVYYTDRAGGLHVVRDEGDQSTDTVLRTSGYAAVTGLHAGACNADVYSESLAPIALLFVDRRTGIARLQRLRRAAVRTGGTLMPAVRVRPDGWTWQRIG